MNYVILICAIKVLMISQGGINRSERITAGTERLGKTSQNLGAFGCPLETKFMPCSCSFFVRGVGCLEQPLLHFLRADRSSYFTDELNLRQGKGT